MQEGLEAAVLALYRAARCAQVLATDDPLDPGSSRILASVVRLGPVRPSTVAQENHIDALVRRGLVAKSADPDDARAALVEATADGHDVLQVLLANRSAAIGSALAGWSGRDRRALARLLVRLADDLDDLITTKERR